MSRMVSTDSRHVGRGTNLTNLIEHLVAFIQHEDADCPQTKVLVTDQRIKTAGGTDDNVGVGILVLEDLGVLGDGRATVEHSRLDIRHVLAETVVLVANLEGQFTGVAHDQDRTLAGDRLDLLQRRENEDSRLTKSGLGLADNVTSQHGLGNAGLLHCSGCED
jgi:hypothetical protein